jgi:putative SOS response-associated peptidase YedK
MQGGEASSKSLPQAGRTQPLAPQWDAMCGRYTMTSPDDLVHEFGLFELPFDLSPRFNVAPTQEAPVVLGGETRQLKLFRWGLVPSWSRDMKGAARMINARAETVDEKPSFRDAFATRRCLVCTDGFYEWRREGKSRLPHFMSRKNKEPIAFAGIWESFRAQGDVLVHTFAALTTEANDLMSPIHHRMPVIIERADYERWLDPALRTREPLDDLLRPADDTGYQIIQVSERVNSVANDSELCLRPGPDQQTLF